MKIDLFEMERTQCLYESTVDFNLSESGVLPLTVDELLQGSVEKERFLGHRLSYCESDGSLLLRERIAQFYPDCRAGNITVVNGGAEAIYVTLWTLLGKDGRLACMVPNYMQGWGIGRAYADGVDTFSLEPRHGKDGSRWALDADSFQRAVSARTNVILVTNPNNPTGAVLNEEEMKIILDAARKVGAWLIVDEIYRGAEVDSDAITPTFWGRYEKVIVTSGLSKAFGLPGLRIGWVVAPRDVIEQVWMRHDYLTLTPGLLNDRLASIALEPARRQKILERTRGIIRTNLTAVEAWIGRYADLLKFIRPKAGAIAYFQYDFDYNSVQLFEDLRKEYSVLVTPADHFGATKGLRIGFGYDLQKTLRGLARLGSFLEACRDRGASTRVTREATTRAMADN